MLTLFRTVHSTMNMLGLAKRVKARFLLSSTSGEPVFCTHCHEY